MADDLLEGVFQANYAQKMIGNVQNSNACQKIQN